MTQQNTQTSELKYPINIMSSMMGIPGLVMGLQADKYRRMSGDAARRESLYQTNSSANTTLRVIDSPESISRSRANSDFKEITTMINERDRLTKEEVKEERQVENHGAAYTSISKENMITASIR